MVENIGQPNLKVELTSSPAAKPGVGNVRRVSWCHHGMRRATLYSVGCLYKGMREGGLGELLVCEALKVRLSWRAGLIQR